MSYVIIFILLWPFKMLMKPFHRRTGRNLVIQTAKIGDFVNITPLLKHLKKSDVLISKTVLPLAEHDATIDSIYLIEDYKNPYSVRFVSHSIYSIATTTCICFNQTA